MAGTEDGCEAAGEKCLGTVGLNAAIHILHRQVTERQNGQVNRLDELWEWVQRLQTGQRLTLNAPVKDATRCWIWISRKLADLHDLSLLAWLGVADESGNGKVHVMRN